MKFNLSLILILFAGALSAQILKDNVANVQAIEGLSDRTLAGGFSFKNPPRKVDGSVYLFSNWNNITIIEMKNGKHFLVRNANINIQRNTLESQIGTDSTYVFNTTLIKKFSVNNVPYKMVFSDEGKRIYQVIYDSDDFSLLKGFKVTFIEGSPNPMVNRPMDKYVRSSSFYLQEDNSIKPFKIKKSTLLRLLDANPSRKKAFIKFMNDNKLSYKDETDIEKAFRYSSNVL